jgi:hypothetical protein
MLDTYTIGRRIKCTVSAGVIYGYVSAASYSSSTLVTVVWDSIGLDAGLSNASIGILNPTYTAIPAQKSPDATFLDTVHTWLKSQAVVPVVLTSLSASVAVDLSLSNNFSHALTENTSLSNPSNMVAGSAGQITITQNASSAKTLGYGSQWVYNDGSANPPVSTTLNAVNLLSYYVVDATHIWFNLAKSGQA